MTLKVCSTKAKIDKRDYIKLKQFCTVSRVERQCTEWEKIFAPYTSRKGLLLTLRNNSIAKIKLKKSYFKNGQMTLTHISQKKTYSQQIHKENAHH